MFEQYNIYFYRIFRFVLFIFLSFLVLQFVPTQTLDHIDLCKILILLAIIFIVIETYIPNVYFD